MIHRKILIFLFLLLSLSTVSAVQINDTTFFSTISNFTIFVDTITLDTQVTTNQTIEFFNLTSRGSNFTNTNATFDAVASFFGLDIGITLRNINTSTDLFTSTTGTQDFNASFTSGQVIITNNKTTPPPTNCTPRDKAILNLIVILFALAIILVPIALLIREGKIVIKNVTLAWVIIVFIGVILGIIFIQIIADSIVDFCGQI